MTDIKDAPEAEPTTTKDVLTHLRTALGDGVSAKYFIEKEEIEQTQEQAVALKEKYEHVGGMDVNVVQRLDQLGAQYEIDKEHNYTDLGNAHRFCDRFGSGFRCVGSTTNEDRISWLKWDKRRWTRDTTAQYHREAQRLTVILHQDAEMMMTQAKNKLDEAEGTGDTDMATLMRDQITKTGSYKDWIFKMESAGKLSAMVKNASVMLRIEGGQVDHDQYALNMLNGTLDLRTRKITPHRRDDMITKLIPIHYYPDAQCPVWEAFLKEIMLGDMDLVNYLQKMVGYCLTGDTSEQAFFILFGPTAQNGKSTFMEVLRSIFGDYYMKTPISTFVQKKSGGVPNDVAALQGARMVYASEAEDNMRLNGPLVKEITGGEDITARFLHKEFFTFKPQCKIIMATNQIPSFDGSDPGILRRMRVVPFNYRVPDDRRVKHFERELLRERHGILAWAIEGCHKWRKEGLEPTKEMLEEMKQAAHHMDALGRFISERCRFSEDRVNEGYKEMSHKLHKGFNDWNKLNDMPTRTSYWLYKNLKMRKFIRTEDGGNIFIGIELRQD